MKSCLSCNKEIPTRNVYCNNSCQADHKYKEYITEWLKGNTSGSRGINTENFSGHILRYLKEKGNNQCAVCGWDKVNSRTGRVPLEIDHIDGNHENNRPDNLQQICPNCHSLTDTYRNLNYGHGRKWRKDKYIKV